MIQVRMQQNTQNQPLEKLSPKITVVGVGGAGCNAVNNMIATNLEGVEFIACNTDAQALANCLADTKVQLGANITSGLGAGANPEIGRAAAEESIADLSAQLDNVNMVFVTCGMGGGTGTGAAPVVAKAAREKGILTVGVITKPFHFEGAHRMKSAEAGIEEMQQYVDTLIVIPNQNLFRIANEKTTFAEAFKMADTVLQSGVRGVTDLMVREGLINLDFADVKAVMLEMGKAMMGTGEASGERRATEAAEKAINNPLLDDVSMKGARGLIINITGGYDMTLFEVDEACNRIRDEVDNDANIIFGSTFDESMEGEIRVSIVATGIDSESMRKPRTTGGYTSTGTGGTLGGRAMPKTVDQQGEQTVAQPQSAQPQEQPVQTAQPQQQQAAQAEMQTPPLTATRAGGSFIPPKPAEAARETSAAPSAANSIQGITYPAQGQQEQSQAATAQPTQTPAPQQQEFQAQPVQTEEPAAPAAVRPQGLVLNPPKTPEPKKRPPSLFERFTTGVKEKVQQFHGADDDDQGTTGSAGGSQGSGNVPGYTSLRAEPPMSSGSQQGNLNIEPQVAPSQPRQEKEDDLDIPAFLRRQVN